MKKPLFPAAALLSPFFVHAAEDKPTGYDGKPGELHVYLLIGQSNMSGRAPITDAMIGLDKK